MWIQEKKPCWWGVVGLACAMVGVGCAPYVGPREPMDYPVFGLKVRTGIEKGQSEGSVPQGFSRPLSMNEIGLLQVTPDQPLMSDEVGIVSTDVLTGSFNANVASGSTLLMELRVRFRQEFNTTVPSEWTPWVRIAWAGKKPAAKQSLLDDRLGSVEIDELRLKRKTDRMQVRLRLESDDRNAVATVSRIDIPIANRYYGDVERGAEKIAPIDIPVPFRSQKTSDGSLSGRLCSPTSVAMVLAYYGVDATVEEVAKKCYDPEYDIYGNWPRNIQAAYEFGVPGSLVRMQSWREVGKILETGQPLIISIRAERGELRGAPYDATEGHLIVLRGMDEFGNLIVNDPACGTAEDGKRAYRRSDLTKVWLKATNGTAYLLGTPEMVQKARYRWNKEQNTSAERGR
ncbi:MAG: C39 family peptidase [Planctomycetes bacterium]|nr:C39 family peptidase [Planctomycetota bacterium]